jgi:hypothetical protein
MIDNIHAILIKIPLSLFFYRIYNILKLKKNIKIPLDKVKK